MAEADTDKKKRKEGSTKKAKKDAKRQKLDNNDDTKKTGAARRVERKSKKNKQEKNGKKKEEKEKTPLEDNGAEKKPRGGGEVWSKSKKKRMRLLQAKMKKKATVDSSEPAKTKTNSDEPKKESKDSTTQQPEDTIVPTTNKGTSSLQNKYAARLSGSRFRILNEELYTTTSKTAFDNFTSNPELFTQYHEGFRHQVENWPSNPVDVMLTWLTKKYASKKTTTVVADFGCGDAELAKRLLKVPPVKDKKVKTSSNNDPPFKVHSFDLVAGPGLSDLVTPCDMANVPLANKSVDVAIFCLALMGTNVADFLLEAHRVLKDDGKVKIAEVRSRFESADKNSSSGKNNNDLDEFVEKLEKLGFECKNVDRSNKMFIMMELIKNGKTPDKRIEVRIKPCIYKRR